jgi:hypothetical protein
VVAGGLAVLALGAGAYAIGNGAESSPKAVAAATRVLGSGTAGVFAVSVTGTECGLSAVGPDELRQSAKGQFCLVSVSVKNNGGEPALLDGGAQRAVDAAGRAYPVADRAAVFLNDQQPSLLDEVGPGATVRGVLPFDVPAGASLSALMVHESMSGAAVRVPFS